MTHKRIALGVALTAMLALGVITSSAASAANFTASTYTTVGTAESGLGNDVFTTEAGKVECASHFQGWLTSAGELLTVWPFYTSCRAFGFLSASVSVGGCSYDLKWPSGSADQYSVRADIECGYEGAIIITAAKCKVRIGSQFTNGSIAATNNTAAGDLSLKANITGIEYYVTEDGFACPFAGAGPKYGATYTQGSAVTFSSTNGAKLDIG